MTTKEILPGLHLHRDSCNAYILVEGEEALVIDPGRGDLIAALPSLGARAVPLVLHTHAHRDLCGADAALAAAGAEILVPAGTRARFADAGRYWLDVNTYYGFAYGDKYFGPLRDLPAAREIAAGERINWKSWELEAIATPGHGDVHLSFLLRRDGRKILFAGDLIAGPGQVWEMDSLQSTYEEWVQGPADKRRIPALFDSLARARELAPDLILPAHGEPFVDCAAAIGLLESRLRALDAAYNEVDYFAGEEPSRLPEVELLQTCASQYLVLAPDGEGLLVDAGFDDWANPDGSRADIMASLGRHPRLRRVDIVVPTHNHCDHMSLMRAVRHRWGARLYAEEGVAAILAEPARWFVPCLEYFPIAADRVFRHGESFSWKGWTFTMYRFPGQTYWHQALLADFGGTRVLFTGDSVDGRGHVRNVDTWNRTEVGGPGSAWTCLKVLEEARPDFLATGHWGIRRWLPEYDKRLRDYLTRRDALLTELIAQEDPNLGNGWYWTMGDPFRQVAAPGERVPLAARITNYFHGVEEARVRLAPPPGWTASPASATVVLEPGKDASARFSLAIPADVARTRYMIGVEIEVGGRVYGELGCAVVDIGADHSREAREPGCFTVNVPGYGF